MAGLLSISLGHAAEQGPGLPITLVNYSRLPVPAAAISIDEQSLRGPVRVRRADTGTLIPQARGQEEGRAVLRLLVSLPPASRLNLVAEPVESWPENQRTEARPGRIANGVVRVDFADQGWQFGFDAERSRLLEGGLLDFWVDNQNRGRIANVAPEKLGLARFREGTEQGSTAFISPEGRPSYRTVRRMGGLAKDMTVTETFELVPGMPLLLCRGR